MTIFEWALLIAAGVAAPFIVLALIGFCLPSRHRFSRQVVIRQSPATLWNAIANLERLPSWWSPCAAVERLDDRDGQPIYRETFQQGRRKMTLTLAIVEAREPARFATRIVDERGPFRGTWTYEIEAAGSESRVTLTEDGQVRHPIIRVMFRLFMTKSAFVDSYLQDLGRKFGEQVAPA